MLFNKSKIKFFLIFALVLFVATTCKEKQESFDAIPEASFSLFMNSNDLFSIGDYSAVAIDNGGVNGLIVYKISDSEYQAFERLCTNYPADTTAVKLDNTTMSATCPKCKSVFKIDLDGQVNKGPARYSLKQYQTSLLNGRLEIWN